MSDQDIGGALLALLFLGFLGWAYWLIFRNGNTWDDER